MRIIDDNNWSDVIDEAQNTSEHGFGLIPRDYDEVPLGSMPYTAPFAESMPIIQKSEWADRIKLMEGKQARYAYSGTPDEDNQNGLSYCWSFSLTQSLKACRDREGQPHVDLCAESLGHDVGWRNAGNYCGSAIKAAAEYGFCERSYSNNRYSLNHNAWKAGWEENAKSYRITEWWELGHGDMLQEAVTALLLGFPVYVGYNWAGHAVCLQEVLVANGKLSFWTPNTWGPGQDWLLTGSKMIPDEAYVPRTTTWSAT